MPKFMVPFALFALTFAITAQAQDTPATQPATAPSADEMLTDKSQLAGYGAEVFRLVNERDEIVSRLRNGMTVFVKRVPSPVVAVRGYALTGGVYEGKWLGGGLSHLLEHLVAGGTNARRSEEQNRNLLQAIGNDSNAYTTTDHTAFFVNTTAQHMEQAVDLVTGWMLTAQITDAEYRREYQVVQRELEMDKGQPDFVFAQLTNLVRYRVSPARVPVIGYQEVIQALKAEDVRGYYHMAYQPNNLIFAVSGNLDPETMLKAVQKNVADATPGREFSHEIDAEPPVLAPRTLVATFPKLGQARLELGFPSVKIDHPDLYALDLLSTILGNGEGSILTQIIRDRKQLATSIGVNDDTPSYADGTFAVDVQCDADKIPAVTKAVLEELEKVKSTPIDAVRIARAKVQMRVQHVAGLQTAESVAAELATDYLQTGDPHFSDRYTDRIQNVSAEQLQDAARRYLDSNRLLTTALLPSEAAGSVESPKAEDLLRAAAPAAPTTAAKAESSGNITRVALPNGVVLLHKRISTTPMVSIKMYAAGGVTAEDATNNGIGNLTMQLLPRGTKTRTARQIAEFFDSIGATLGTDCGNNTWYWEASCLTGDFEKTLEVYADVVNNPSFPGEELDPMKERIAAAIGSEDADWTAQAMRFFKKSYFGPLDSPRQFIPIGTKENLQRFTIDDTQKWYRDTIARRPRVLAIFGDIELDKATELAKKFLGGGPASPAIPPVQPIQREMPTNAGVASMQVERVEIQKTEQPLAGIVIGFDSRSVIINADEPVLTLADCMTSGYAGPTGYLFDVLRGKGLVYVVDAQDMPGVDPKAPGTFMAYAGCDPKKVNEVVDLMLENIARLQGTPADVQPDWFERSKQLITTADALENETPDAQASTAALDELYGLGYGHHACFADRINTVTLDQVRVEARDYLSKCVVTISTPQPDVVNEKPGERQYKSFPPVDLTPRGVQHDNNAGGGK